VGQSVESGRLLRNSKDVSWSRLRRSPRSRVVTKWCWSPGRHGRGGWIAPLSTLFRVPRKALEDATRACSGSRRSGTRGMCSDMRCRFGWDELAEA